MPINPNLAIVWPPAPTTIRAKATSQYGDNWSPWYAADPTIRLNGIFQSGSWVAANLVTSQQRFHLDVGRPVVAAQLYVENGHNNGDVTTSGVNAFTLWGSNSGSDFDTVSPYSADGTWAPLRVSTSTLARHSAFDGSDPQYVDIDSTIPYRFYAIKCATNHGHAEYIGLRRVAILERVPRPIARLPLRGRC